MLLFPDNQIKTMFFTTIYVWNTFIQTVKIFFSVTENTSLHSSERYAPKNWSKLFISPSVMGRHLSNSVPPDWTETQCMVCTSASAEVTWMTSLKATTDIMQIFTGAVFRGPPQPYIGQSFQSISRYEAHISFLSPWPFEDFPQRSQLCFRCERLILHIPHLKLRSGALTCRLRSWRRIPTADFSSMAAV